MNFFDFFGLPVRYAIDPDELKAKYFEKSRKYHPDLHSQAKAAVQAEMLEKSAFNNRAYKVLSDPDQRLKYLLDLFEILKEEGKNEVPHDFLMAMMDYNEAMMELEMEPDPEKLQQLNEKLKELENDLSSDVLQVMKIPDASSLTEQEWSALAEYYLKKRYLRRFRSNLSKLEEQP